MRAITLVALAALGCDAAPPRVLEVHTPGKTADTHGPYQVTAVTSGAIDEAHLVWHVGDPEAAMSHSMDRRSGAWEGEIPGQPYGTEVRLWIEATGPGGETRSPPAGAHVFRVLSHGGACVVDGDCPSDEICDRFEGRCHVPPETCEDDGDCGADYICVEGDCRFRPDSCEASPECGAGFECVEGRCVREPDCTGDADCPGGRCLSGQCVADPPGGCGDGCPPNMVCEDDECVPVDNGPCGGCPGGLRCLEETGECVECHADGQCGDGSHCEMARFRCADGERTRPCEPCAPGSCSSGQACSRTYAFTCLPGCGPRNQCPRGSNCNEGVCQPDEFCYAAECARDEDCDSAVCQAGFCEARQFCTRDAECGADRSCRAGRCREQRAFCLNPGECERGELCVAGRCIPGEPQTACEPCGHSLDCGSAAVCADTTGSGDTACFSFCRDSCPNAMECIQTGGGRRTVGICVDPFEQTCVSRPSCGGDDFEPNDGIQQARPLAPNRGAIRAVMCRDDDDWYLLERTGAQAFIDITLNAGGTLRSFDADGTPLSQVPLQRGEVTFELQARSTYLMFDTVQPNEVGYTLEFRERAAACDDDNLEPDDQLGQASVLGNGANIRAVACPNDADWYRLRMRNNHDLAFVTLTPSAPDQSLRYEVVREDGAVLDAGNIGRPIDLQVENQRRNLYLNVVCEGCAQSVGYTVQTRYE